MTPEVREEVVNVKLAEILSRDLYIDCRAERVLRGRRIPDIRCFYRGLIISVEASYHKSDAEKDAEKRIEQGLTDVAIALFIKDWYKDVSEEKLDDAIRKSRFDVKVFVSRDIANTLLQHIGRELKKLPESTTGWFVDVDIPTLASIIKNVIEFLGKEEEIKKLIEDVEDVVSRFMSTLQSLDHSRDMYRRIYDILYRLYGLRIAEAEHPEVVFGQAALSVLLSATFYEYARNWHTELKPLSSLVENSPIQGLSDALEDLLKIDYKTAVETPLEILRALPPNPGIAERVKELYKLAVKISQSPSFLRRDFAGRVYHRITGDIALRKGFATYYTEVPSAYLLAHLAVETLLSLDGRDIRELTKEEARSIVKLIEGMKVADLACGSGTLLIATYSTLHRIAMQLKFYHDLEDVDLDQLSKKIIEDDIYGIDALRYASQITALNLALISSGNISKENIYTIYLGHIPEKNTSWLGSLELLNSNKKIGGLLAWIEKGYEGTVERVSVEGLGNIFMIPEAFDLIIMNPPFTRATGRTKQFDRGKGLFGFTSDEETRKKILERYEDIRNRVKEELIDIAKSHANLFPEVIRDVIKGKEGLKQYLSIGQAGEGLLFLYLAYKYVKSSGDIAFVLPRALLTGVSWFLVRALLATKFHVKYIVVSSDAEKGYNFSEGVSLSETLIVAKRSDSVDVNLETVFVNLLSKPSTAMEAMMFAEEIESTARQLKANRTLPIQVGGARALILKVLRKQLLENVDNWNRFVAVPNEYLVDLVVNNLLAKGKVVL